MKKEETNSMTNSLADNNLILLSHELFNSITQLLDNPKSITKNTAAHIENQLSTYTRTLSLTNYPPRIQQAATYLFCLLLDQLFVDQDYSSDKEKNAPHLNKFHQESWDNPDYLYQSILDNESATDFLEFCHFFLSFNPTKNKELYFSSDKKKQEVDALLASKEQPATDGNLHIKTVKKQKMVLSKKHFIAPGVMAVITIIAIIIISIIYNDKLSNATQPINDTLQEISQFSGGK